MVSTLITVAVIAWCAQLALGGWQISRFNRAFDKLSQQGRVGVGRSGGRFKPWWWLPWRWTNSSG